MEYKTYKELKEELGDKFEEYMYKSNIELLTKIDKALNELDKYRIDLDLPSFTDKIIINTRKILRGN